MKSYFFITALLLILTSCTKDLTFKEHTFHKKTTLACKGVCPEIRVKIPYAESTSAAVSDSINNKIFNVLKDIIYVDEKPCKAKNYDELLASFINSYEKMQKEFPDDIIGWEGQVKGTTTYQSSSLLNIQIDYYTFTGGAHGYHGLKSLLFDPRSGQIINNNALFTDVKAFTQYAEKQFRIKYKIPANGRINATGYQFRKNRFHLPDAIFYTPKGLLLYYNPYEASCYADGPKELELPYTAIDSFLKIR